MPRSSKINRGAVWIVEGALIRFGLRRLVHIEGDVMRVVAHAKPILRYYANSIAHFEDGVLPLVETRATNQT